VRAERAGDASARQLELIAQYCEAERDGRVAWGCEETERAIGIDLAGALGMSFTSATLLAGSARTLTEQLPHVLRALRHGSLGLFAARQPADP
jgi:hypothetical protein